MPQPFWASVMRSSTSQPTSLSQSSCQMRHFHSRLDTHSVYQEVAEEIDFLCQFICNAILKSSFYCVLKVIKVNLGLLGTKTEWVLPWGWSTNPRYSPISPGLCLPKFFSFVYPKVSFNVTLMLQRSYSANSNAYQVFLCTNPGCFSG